MTDNLYRLFHLAFVEEPPPLALAKVNPRDIEALIRKTGSKNPEQWYLIAKYYYDSQPGD